MKIAFRVNIGKDIGLGHAKRCLSLAYELKQRDIKSTFFFNQINEYIANHFIDFPFFEMGQYDDQVSDAQEFLNQINQLNLKFDWVLLDSYLLRKPWEDLIKTAGLRLIVIDDLNKDPHNCDILIDQKFEHEQTDNRYERLVPTSCLKLLGPQFALLAPEYTQEIQYKIRGNQERLRVLFGIGGGGDFSRFQRFIQKALDHKDLQISVIIGPFATNFEYLYELETEGLTLFQNLPTLKDLYINHDLFVGALGTSLYELAATKMPAITFSIAENQYNNLRDLEAYGHYFHLNSLKDEELFKILPVIENFKMNYDRIMKLRLNAPLKFDHLGCKRIVDCILAQENKYPINEFWNPEHNRSEPIYTNGDFSLYKINDTNINHYLECRNLPKNSQNMSIQESIPQYEHYRWWLQNSRDSFLLQKNGEDVLYIWHQCKEFESREYLIGGWFVCQENTGFDAAMCALNWQLSFCQKDQPQGKWVAVIKKDNQFVNMLNQYLGFKSIEPDTVDYRATQYFFPEATPEEFNFVMK